MNPPNTSCTPQKRNSLSVPKKRPQTPHRLAYSFAWQLSRLQASSITPPTFYRAAFSLAKRVSRTFMSPNPFPTPTLTLTLLEPTPIRPIITLTSPADHVPTMDLPTWKTLTWHESPAGESTSPLVTSFDSPLLVIIPPWPVHTSMVHSPPHAGSTCELCYTNAWLLKWKLSCREAWNAWIEERRVEAIDSRAAGRRRGEQVRRGGGESVGPQRRDGLKRFIRQRATPREGKSELELYRELLQRRRAMTRRMGRERKARWRARGGGGSGRDWVPRSVVRVRYVVRLFGRA